MINKNNYIDCLHKFKKGGEIDIDCGCHKPVVKSENGGKFSFFKNFVNKLYNTK